MSPPRIDDGLTSQRRYSLRHRERGLCTHCPRPVLPGLTICAACQASRWLEVRTRRGPKLCPWCGAEVKEPHKRYHPDCLRAKQNEAVCHYQREDPAGRANHLRAAKEWQARQKAEGLCICCGEPRGRSRAFCDDCLLRNRDAVRRRKGNRPWRPGGRGRPPLEVRGEGAAR